VQVIEGKATGIPVIRDEMAINGNPEPVFYTDEENILFLVTLPCHIEFKGTKSVSKVTKVVSKVSEEEVNLLFLEGIDIQSLSSLIDNDISDLKDYIRALLVSKTGTKSSGKRTKSRISGTKTLALIDMMAINGNPEPVFYTDEENILFLVTLQCNKDWLVTKSVTKSENKLTREDIDLLFSESFDLQELSSSLDNDISDMIGYVREKIVTKSTEKVTKSAKKVTKSLT
jgi:predicted HTH transcriptional regulator